jgi:hypothetical protein
VAQIPEVPIAGVHIVVVETAYERTMSVFSGLHFSTVICGPSQPA